MAEKLQCNWLCKLPKWLKLSVLLAAVVLAIVLVLSGIQGKPKSSFGVNLPPERIMVSDCSDILRQCGASGSVLMLDIRDQKVYEQYQVAIVVCDVLVLEKGKEIQYTVKLHYEYEQDGWMLNNASKMER